MSGPVDWGSLPSTNSSCVITALSFLVRSALGAHVPGSLAYLYAALTTVFPVCASVHTSFPLGSVTVLAGSHGVRFPTTMLSQTTLSDRFSLTTRNLGAKARCRVMPVTATAARSAVARLTIGAVRNRCGTENRAAE